MNPIVFALRRPITVMVLVIALALGSVLAVWRMDVDIFPSLKRRLLPPLDQGVAALLDDLEASGLLDETLVVMLGNIWSPAMRIFRSAQ